MHILLLFVSIDVTLKRQPITKLNENGILLIFLQYTVSLSVLELMYSEM